MAYDSWFPSPDRRIDGSQEVFLQRIDRPESIDEPPNIRLAILAAGPTQCPSGHVAFERLAVVLVQVMELVQICYFMRMFKVIISIRYRVYINKILL